MRAKHVCVWVCLFGLVALSQACSDDKTNASDTTDDTSVTDGSVDTAPDTPADVSQDTDADTDAGGDTPSDTPADAPADMPPSDMTDVAMDVPADMADATDMTMTDMTGLPDGPSSGRQTAVPLSATSAGNGFHEYLPVGYGDGQDRPLLVFWHGLGENGNGESDLNSVLSNGPPRLINRDEWPSDRPFIVLSPQHSGGGCPGSNEIRDFLAWAITNYDVDTSRVYLTGLSCGAIGSWNYLGNNTNTQIAATVLIAGDGRSAWNNAGCDLGLVPIWGFHGDADGTVNVNGTNVPIDNLLAAPGGNPDCPSPPRAEVLKTIYPGVGHNSWSRTYDGSAGHDIYSWLLTKTR